MLKQSRNVTKFSRLFCTAQFPQAAVGPGSATCGPGAACGSLAPLKWLSGIGKTWDLNLHLNITMSKLITI